MLSKNRRLKLTGDLVCSWTDLQGQEVQTLKTTSKVTHTVNAEVVTSPMLDTFLVLHYLTPSERSQIRARADDRELQGNVAVTGNMTRAIFHIDRRNRNDTPLLVTLSLNLEGEEGSVAFIVDPERRDSCFARGSIARYFFSSAVWAIVAGVLFAVAAQPLDLAVRRFTVPAATLIGVILAAAGLPKLDAIPYRRLIRAAYFSCFRLILPALIVLLLILTLVVWYDAGIINAISRRIAYVQNVKTFDPATPRGQLEPLFAPLISVPGRREIPALVAHKIRWDRQVLDNRPFVCEELDEIDTRMVKDRVERQTFVTNGRWRVDPVLWLQLTAMECRPERFEPETIASGGTQTAAYLILETKEIEDLLVEFWDAETESVKIPQGRGLPEYNEISKQLETTIGRFWEQREPWPILETGLVTEAWDKLGQLHFQGYILTENDEYLNASMDYFEQILLHKTTERSSAMSFRPPEKLILFHIMVASGELRRSPDHPSLGGIFKWAREYYLNNDAFRTLYSARIAAKFQEWEIEARWIKGTIFETWETSKKLIMADLDNGWRY